MKKKAYLRTIEVAFAIILTFTVAYFIIPRASAPQPEPALGILAVLEKSPQFRDCAVLLNHICVEALLREHVPPNYDFDFAITEDPNQSHGNLPEKTIIAESLFISGNINLYSPRIIMLYYWRKE